MSQGQDGLGVVEEVKYILEHPDRVKLLFFNGVMDLVCNHVGNEKFLYYLDWEGQEKWIESQRYSWQASSNDRDEIAGYVKEYDNLIFLRGTFPL